MQAMRYEIALPSDYDMSIIRSRVAKTGHLMDDFPDLLFKAFLISEQAQGQLTNNYCPLYIWKRSEGMTKFIFEGPFENILKSFGWQSIQIGITSTVLLTDDFSQSCWVTEEVLDISPSASLKDTKVAAELEDKELGKVVVYNPDKWKKVTYTFWKEKPINTNLNVFEILHLSLPSEPEKQ
ncbi:DUF4865 family protein [Streptococcus mutans]|uniref:DUF4865 family protein n=1 Tax=Streptococcus mutans TaxID=1309 RepID=UPI0002B53ADB|nr:DUF4865 family protein [Streptococcus mutans]EMB63557.1 hypothetical protein SMU22_08587 [Streptococcus mutans 4SM1]EMC48613.1 hypothetical protein SMU103_05001 [Streptococcus mutans SA38]MDP5866539.1 DUF4865 family protein [Streptococcus mutans]MDP5874284.1 DUF4865 family protein [Streptococcus mutans]